MGQEPPARGPNERPVALDQRRECCFVSILNESLQKRGIVHAGGARAQAVKVTHNGDQIVAGHLAFPNPTCLYTIMPGKGSTVPYFCEDYTLADQFSGSSSERASP
jgi:hypothetical protein